MSIPKKIKSITAPVITQADNAAVQHQHYIDQFVTRGRQELYSVLASIYSVCLAVEQSGHRDAIVEQMRKLLRDNHDVRISKNAAAIAVVIRYITRAATKTVSVYKRVFISAMANGIGEADLAAYITANGGVDKCGKAIATNDEKREQAVFEKKLMTAATYQLATQQPLGKVTFDAQITPRLPKAADVKFVHAVCRTNEKTGELEVLGMLYPSSEMERMALDLQILCCRAAAIANHGDMYSFCKENTLNVDIVHRWMASNGIADAAAANAKLMELDQLIQTPSSKREHLKAA
jgi:hypothetical protein